MVVVVVAGWCGWRCRVIWVLVVVVISIIVALRAAWPSMAVEVVVCRKPAETVGILSLQEKSVLEV